MCNETHELATPARQTRSDESCNSASIPAVDQATPPPLTPAQRITELEAENEELQAEMQGLEESIDEISEEMEKTLRRNTYISFASKYYHSGNFYKSRKLVEKSFEYGIDSKGITRYLKCILFRPFQSVIAKD